MTNSYKLMLNIEKIINTFGVLAAPPDWFQFNGKRYTVAAIIHIKDFKQLIFSCDGEDFVVNYYKGKAISSILRKILK